MAQSANNVRTRQTVVGGHIGAFLGKWLYLTMQQRKTKMFITRRIPFATQLISLIISFAVVYPGAACKLG
jgi:hypothetical protein